MQPIGLVSTRSVETEAVGSLDWQMVSCREFRLPSRTKEDLFETRGRKQVPLLFKHKI